MKKQLLFLSIAMISLVSFAQTSTEEFKPSGTPLFKVYSNFNTDLSKNATQKSAFEIQRAYFGYNYKFSKDISAKITFDVGNNSAGSSFTTYLKYAELDWVIANGVKLSFGLIEMKQFKEQEDFWGYRYLFKSFQDQNGFASSADLGLNAEVKLAKNLKANFTAFNGEGYKNVQDINGNQAFGAGLIYTPIKGLITKVYFDTQSSTGSKAVNKMAFFAGYDISKWRLGVEYNKMNNGKKYSSPSNNHNLDGISVYSTYVINKKVEIFGRFDQLNSNTLAGDTAAWNISKDGSQIIAGIQYAPVKGVKFSLDYQGYNFKDATKTNNSLVFLNAEFKL